MPRGLGALAKAKPCICENKNEWYVENNRTVQKGKSFGKKISDVCCRKCGGFWSTSAKYIETLPSKTEFIKRYSE